MKFIANLTRNADRVNRSDMLQSIFADKSVLPSTCRQIHVFLACRFNKDFDFLEILFSKFAGMLHFRRDTRELSHALVMQRRSTPLPDVIHAISKIVWEYRLEGTRL